MKLGRKFPTSGKLKLKNYLGAALPPAPPNCSFLLAMTEPWGVMGNDVYGDCTCAAMGHAVQVVTSNSDNLVTPPDAEILTMYPHPPDEGWTCVDAMNYMVSTGLSGVKADAYADLDPTNLDEARQAIWLFGQVYTGAQITQADMDATKAGKPWASTDLSNILGGHAIIAAAYSPQGVYFITWGLVQFATWDWWTSHVDEAHAVLFFPWVKNTVNCSPNNFDIEQLEADLKEL